MAAPFCDHCRNQGAWSLIRGQWIDAPCPKCGRLPAAPALPDRKPVALKSAREDEVARLRAAHAEMTATLAELEGFPRDAETLDAIAKTKAALASIRKRRVLIDPTIDNEETAA